MVVKALYGLNLSSSQILEAKLVPNLDPGTRPRTRSLLPWRLPPSCSSGCNTFSAGQGRPAHRREATTACCHKAHPVNRRIESIGHSLATLFHLRAKGIKALLPIAGIRCDARDPKLMCLAGLEPRSVLRVAAVDPDAPKRNPTLFSRSATRPGPQTPNHPD
jgi:hypothetical protein